MAEKSQKAKKTKTQKICTFPASAEEINQWKAAAKGLDRSLSWWIRTQLNKAVPAISAEKEISYATSIDLRGTVAGGDQQ